MNINADTSFLQSEISSGIWSAGYRRFSLNETVKQLGIERALDSLIDAYRQMPLDPYDKAGTRYRRYGRGIYTPWTKTISWIQEIADADGRPKAPYYQASHNPEHVGQYRYFHAIPDEVLRNPVLQLCAWSAVTQTEWFNEDARYPISVGIHMVAQIVSTERPRADVSPAVMHQDGEAFDFVILVARENIEGGESFIGKVEDSGKRPEELGPEATERFTLSEPLAGFGVKDEAVSHGVSPVLLAPGNQTGFRYTLLVDTTPMREALR
ncbi:hypothetical protein FB593_12310 [Rhizobium sp. SJZ105]|uniref:2OG-Fe dioxygenase family protein n=1 Tax=Rhizobium sp. SJZ105 TaxID=2572678 RepID=UPI0011A92FF8|nr:2OG-Fe dioxygenase family protein [Rhizobium sp. SJZ105]TWC76337.1 hypothetical protein FB593_12310 [Rhizobium sp. SJZ105]